MKQYDFKKTLLEGMEKLLKDFSFPTGKAFGDLIELSKEPYVTIDFDYFKKIIEKIIMDERDKGKKANLELLGRFSELHEIFKNTKEWRI